MAKPDQHIALRKAHELTPGMTFGRRRVIEAVTNAEGVVTVTYTSGHTERFAADVTCLVWTPAPDWHAIACQWRDATWALIHQRVAVLSPEIEADLAMLERAWPA